MGRHKSLQQGQAALPENRLRACGNSLRRPKRAGHYATERPSPASSFWSNAGTSAGPGPAPTPDDTSARQTPFNTGCSVHDTKRKPRSPRTWISWASWRSGTTVSYGGWNHGFGARKNQSWLVTRNAFAHLNNLPNFPAAGGWTKHSPTRTRCVTCKSPANLREFASATKTGWTLPCRTPSASKHPLSEYRPPSRGRPHTDNTVQAPPRHNRIMRRASCGISSAGTRATEYWLLGSRYEAKNAATAYVNILRALAKRDGSFLQRLEPQLQGREKSRLVRNKERFFPTSTTCRAARRLVGRHKSLQQGQAALPENRLRACRNPLRRPTRAGHYAAEHLNPRTSLPATRAARGGQREAWPHPRPGFGGSREKRRRPSLSRAAARAERWRETAGA